MIRGRASLSTGGGLSGIRSKFKPQIQNQPQPIVYCFRRDSSPLGDHQSHSPLHASNLYGLLRHTEFVSGYCIGSGQLCVRFLDANHNDDDFQCCRSVGEDVGDIVATMDRDAIGALFAGAHGFDTVDVDVCNTTIASVSSDGAVPVQFGLVVGVE